jgi:hypothetical protein
VSPCCPISAGFLKTESAIIIQETPSVWPISSDMKGMSFC